MPTYLYYCQGCDEEFEVVHKMSEVLEKCKTCGGDLKRLISSPGSFILKGSGWYETDYGKKKSSDYKFDRYKSELKPARKEAKKNKSGEHTVVKPDGSEETK